MRIIYCFTVIASMVASFALGQQVNMVALPKWMESLPSTPDWWSGVKVEFTNNIASSNYWLYIEESESRIDQLVYGGISPVQERRGLIKYISYCEAFPTKSIDQRKDLILKLGGLYSRLGDHQMAAKVFAAVAQQNPEDWVPLQLLAQECERVGDKEYALQTYITIDKLLKKQAFYKTIGPAIASDNIARLKGKVRECTLKKTDWWEQFKNPPEWLTNTSAVLPPISSFQDGLQFIRGNLSQHNNRQTQIRALSALKEFPAATVSEKEEVFRMIALAYDAVGDHHRAIEAAWQFVNQFSFDSKECVQELKFIALQFDKLGELNHAQEVLNAVSCFE